ncbi:MAG: thiamine-phosphate kinase [Gemmatimonadota bacterium]
MIRAFVAAAGASVTLPVSVGDDAAGLRAPAGEVLLLSTDAAVEGVHFRREWMTWETVGYRAAAASLSDLAAMAASPLGALVTLLLPPELEREVVTAIGSGVGECLREQRTPLIGGDVSRSPGPVAVEVVSVGSCRRPVPRTGARPGDELWVTGVLGGAAAAVWDLSRSMEPDPRCRRRLERPVPRLREARWLAEEGRLTAMIDLSDGLSGDAGHMASASGVRLVLRADAVPLAPAVREFSNQDVALRLGVSGGEDYEILLAAAPGSVEGARERFEERFRIPLTRVGTVERGKGVDWVDGRGKRLPMKPHGYDHFSAAEGETGSPAC